VNVGAGRNGGPGTRASVLALLLVVVALGSACGSSSKKPSAEASITPGIGVEQARPVGSVTKQNAASTVPVSKPRASSAKSKANAAQPSPSPFATPFPADPAVHVSASLSPPTCAHRGTVMTLTVDTNPKAAVGYDTRYSDNRGGGPPPYGAGYGGNGKGITDESGHMTSSWVISSDAPTGIARVDVVVAIANNRWGYKSLTFDVGPDSACT
jgi:hypothetical protein